MRMVPKAHAREIALCADQLAKIALAWKARALTAERELAKFRTDRKDGHE